MVKLPKRKEMRKLFLLISQTDQLVTEMVIHIGLFDHAGTYTKNIIFYDFGLIKYLN